MRKTMVMGTWLKLPMLRPSTPMRRPSKARGSRATHPRRRGLRTWGVDAVMCCRVGACSSHVSLHAGGTK